MVKDILVNLSPSAAADPAVDYAVSIAAAFEAHLAGVAFVYDPVVPATVMGGGVPVELIESQRVENEKLAGGAVSRFEAAAKRAGISFETRRTDASTAGAADRFAHFARRFDLSVVGQPQPDNPMLQDLILESALFESGRPVIAVPYIQKAGFALNQVMVCWDGGRMAARAVADAMPFLTRAKAVEIVVVVERGKEDEMPGINLAQHLARHDVNVTVERIPMGDVAVADALLSHASDTSADLVVMGGYGHSRLRQFILGGVTRTVLKSMTAPTLLSH
jgi:nucleotide-binding universal stress UspA family protein